MWPALTDLDLRFRHMDQYPGLRQVLSMAVPPLEYAVDATDAVDLARLANDEMAGLVQKHPDRFAAGIASLPMNDVDAAIRETERAVETLGLKGIQLYTPVNGRPLDRPEFLPLYEKMAGYGLPIWIDRRTIRTFIMRRKGLCGPGVRMENGLKILIRLFPEDWVDGIILQNVMPGLIIGPYRRIFPDLLN